MDFNINYNGYEKINNKNGKKVMIDRNIGI